MSRASLGKSFVLLMLAAAVPLLAVPGHSAQGADPRPAPPVEYHGTGVVIALMPPPSSLHATRPVIVIHHGPIPPLMPEEMDMPFIAASVTLFENLHPGDHITFTLRETSDALLVVAIGPVNARGSH